MRAYLYLIVFVFGTIVGSFLNCLIFRLEKKEGFLKGRSYCPHCKHPLAWYDLIPVFSFFLLKRHCRYCQKPISWQYPLVEIATGLLFLLIFNFQFSIFNQAPIFNFQTFIALCFMLSVSCLMIVIFVYDLKHFIISDKVLYPAIAASLIYRFLPGLAPRLPIGNYLLSALGAALFFLLIYLFSKGKAMGFGDVKLGILLGLVLGWPKILVALFISFVIGAIIGVGLIIFLKKKLKSEVPFAPFLIIGTLIALFWGAPMVNWYLSLIQ